eukprot:6641945-Pyramimonas_sp.AAC.2
MPLTNFMPEKALVASLLADPATKEVISREQIPRAGGNRSTPGATSYTTSAATSALCSRAPHGHCRIDQ